MTAVPNTGKEWTRLQHFFSAFTGTYLNPDLIVFFGLFLAKVLALASFLIRAVSHKDDLYIQQCFGFSGLSIAIVLGISFSGWICLCFFYPLVERFWTATQRFEILVGEKQALTRFMAASTVLGDLAFFSAFYIFTLQPESDFFVFFFIPIITAAFYLKPRDTLQAGFLSTCLLAVILTVIHSNLDCADPAVRQRFSGNHGLLTLTVNVFFLRSITLLAGALGMALIVRTLRVSKDLFRSLLKDLNVVLWRKDINGLFTFVNEQFRESVGKPYGEIIGASDSILFDYADISFITCFRTGDDEVIRSGRPKVFPDEPFPMRDGSIQFNYVSKTPVFDGNGVICGTQGFFIDMTRQARALTDLTILSSMASHAELMHHELATEIGTTLLCLTSVVGNFGECEPTNSKAAKEVERFLDIVRSGLEKVRDWMRDRARFRANITKRSVVNLVEIVESVFTRLSPLTVPLGAKLHLPPDSLVGSIDPLNLDYAVRNMILNAKEAIERCMPPNGDVENPVFTVSVSKCVPVVNGPAFCSIVVLNSGDIQDRDLHLLERGGTTTVKDDSRMHGFGIRIIRTCARLHEGQFTIQRSPENLKLIRAVLQVPLLTK